MYYSMPNKLLNQYLLRTCVRNTIECKLVRNKDFNALKGRSEMKVNYL